MKSKAQTGCHVGVASRAGKVSVYPVVLHCQSVNPPQKTAAEVSKVQKIGVQIYR